MRKLIITVIVLTFFSCNKKQKLEDELEGYSKESVLRIEYNSTMDYLNYDLKIYVVNSSGGSRLDEWDVDVFYNQNNEMPATKYYEIYQDFKYWLQINKNASEPSGFVLNGSAKIYYNNELIDEIDLDTLNWARSESGVITCVRYE